MPGLDDFTRTHAAKIRALPAEERAAALAGLESRRNRLTTNAVIERCPRRSAEMRTTAAEIDAFIAKIETEEPVR